MARIRTIKPEFFLNDNIADLHPLERIFFIGLWTQADRSGRLEDRPKRLKAALLPYDNFNVDKALDKLHDKKVIYRYTENNCKYIEILNFLKHQYPNIKEPDSTIPAPCQYDTSTPRLGKEGKGKEDKGKGKEIYGQFQNVLLLPEEYLKLVNLYGQDKTKTLIENLSTGIESKGYKYKSHYATILNWEKRDKQKNPPEETNQERIERLMR